MFDRAAHLYDTAALQRALYRPAHDSVVAELRAAGSRRVLDVGCGTGILAARIGEDGRGARVLGCDLSMGMLRRAAARVRGAWVQGDALRLPLRDGALDAVVSTQAFHFLPDRRAALAEFHRVLRPGGLLVIAMVNPRTLAISRLMSRAGTRILGAGSWPTRAELRDEVASSGFDVRAQRGARDLAHTVVTVATARRAPAPAPSRRAV
ncbi:MAG TPA: class I SAM-dependent methyltransferase [Candidatus Dormibacteraeota bacterium]|jgi:ubiquinone/menaquinone biosynthesis C-methylase UbiE|nr:class I SAM-dependent methyltransferase [Candidatus Dormibacteraeota bacterium]